MRLANSEYNISFEFEENRVMLMIIEERMLRLKLVEDFFLQCSGEKGSFVLSEDAQILKISKVVDILLNPFSIDCNDKKILSKLYQEIRDCGNEDFYMEKEKINSDILLLLDKIMLNVPYNIASTLDFDWMEMCKLYNIQLENSGDTLLERLMEYIKIMSHLCSYKLFVLLNFTLYLNEQEMKMLYEFAAYQKVYLLLIEYAMPMQISNEKGCIIDKDGCIIDIVNHDLQHLPGVMFGENQDGFEV